MKRIAGLICAAAFWAAVAQGQAPVTITIDTKVSGPVVPDDFIGLSFGMKALPGNKAGARLFSPTNTSLVTLFQNVGLRHLRVGGTTVESPPATPIPNEADIDSLFAFAKVAGVKKVIYSFRLLETNADLHYERTNAALARYIWAHYQPQLECFAIGNEPDLQRVFKQDYVIRDFATYIDQWHKFATAITNVVPEAKFTGPDGGSGNANWSAKFAAAVKDWGLVTEVAEHYYAGGKGRDVSAEVGIETMLSAKWLTNYENLRKKIADAEWPYRFTEANDHYSGGIPDASDTFTGALWALDFLHWWAAHDAQGVDFHNTQWVVSDIVTPKPDGTFRINPKAYGLKAFDLGAHGHCQPIMIANSQSINLTAYAVHDSSALFVTVINKEHGADAPSADVTIAAPDSGKHIQAIFLSAPGNDVNTKTGVTLGGATINGDGPWLGKWTPLEGPLVKLPPASAVVVKISAE